MTKMSWVRLTILFLLLIGLGIWSVKMSSDPNNLAEQAQLLEGIYQKGNYIEAGIWGIFALGFGRNAWKTSGSVRQHRQMAAVTFFLFGLSDIIEVQTGAWWHPWWLFLWKSLCVISMVIVLILYLQEV